MKTKPHHRELPATNSEFFSDHAWLNPETRKGRVAIRVHRKMGHRANGVIKRGDKNIELELRQSDVSLGHDVKKLKLETLSHLDGVALEYLQIANRIYAPEEIYFDHVNGDLAELENKWKATKKIK